jgi:hypothetical protein
MQLLMQEGWALMLEGDCCLSGVEGWGSVLEEYHEEVAPVRVAGDKSTLLEQGQKEQEEQQEKQ